MTLRNFVAACMLLMTGLSGLQALADVGDACGAAIPPGPACPTQTVPTTILVPEIVYEDRTVTTVGQRPETRARTIRLHFPGQARRLHHKNFTKLVPPGL